MTAFKLELQPDGASGDINNDISKTLNKTPPDGLQQLDHAMPAVRTFSRRIAARPPSPLAPRPSPFCPPASVFPILRSCVLPEAYLNGPPGSCNRRPLQMS